MERTQFKWIGITSTKNMPEIKEVLEKNNIAPEFMDAGTDEVRFGVPRFAKKACFVLINHGWGSVNGKFQKLPEYRGSW